jgi:hypothetical protein
MKESFRTLLAGAIDYAGMFPPATLTLEQAARNYVAYRHGPERWLLGRFVCPMERLAQWCSMVGDDCRELPLSLIAVAAQDCDDLIESLEAGWSRVGVLGCRPQAFEARLPVDVGRHPDTPRLTRLLHSIVAGALTLKLPRAAVFLEVPSADTTLSEAMWRTMLEKAVAMLADYNESAVSARCRAGLKIRTGGLEPAAIPSTARLASFICACHNAHIPWKATAGLHHALRGNTREVGAPLHGFVNLLAADVLAVAHDLDEAAVLEILEDDDPHRFEFDDGWLRWRDLTATTEQVRSARAESFGCFGSCNFVEPCDELRALGWLDPAAQILPRAGQPGASS